MAKYRKKRYYKKFYKRYRRISENYFRARVEATGKVVFPPNQNGQPTLALTNEINKSSISFGEFIGQTTYVNMLKGMFSFYRMTGITIECVPDAANTNGQRAIIAEPVVMIAPRAGDNGAMNYGEVKSINTAILLNPTQSTRKYTKFYGYTGDWIDTNVYPKGAVTVVASSNGQDVNSPSWNFRMMFYLIYKKSKI